MLASACLSLLASFVLSVDAVRLAADPQADLVCNINSVVSCGTVGNSWQAHLFGFPNGFLGLIAEPVVTTLAGASLGNVYTFGVIFAYWLFDQSMFVIGALCHWCLLVTISTTMVFATLTHVYIRDGNLYLPERMQMALAQALKTGLDLLAVTIWMLIRVLMIVGKHGRTLFA